MCLVNIFPKTHRNYKLKAGYKIVVKTEHGDFCSYYIGTKFEKNIEYLANQHYIATDYHLIKDDTQRYYPAGFHCYIKLKDAVSVIKYSYLDFLSIVRVTFNTVETSGIDGSSQFTVSDKIENVVVPAMKVVKEVPEKVIDYTFQKYVLNVTK